MFTGGAVGEVAFDWVSLAVGGEPELSLHAANTAAMNKEAVSDAHLPNRCCKRAPSSKLRNQPLKKTSPAVARPDCDYVHTRQLTRGQLQTSPLPHVCIGRQRESRLTLKRDAEAGGGQKTDGGATTVEHIARRSTKVGVFPVVTAVAGRRIKR